MMPSYRSVIHVASNLYYHLYMYVGCSGFPVWQDGGSEAEMGLRVT